MGSNPSSNQRRESRATTAGSLDPTLPQDVIQKLLSCLKTLPLSLDQNSQNALIKRVELKEITTPGLVIRKGQEPVGIYFLVSGNMQVMSENQKFVLREVQPGGCLGEVSVLFGRRCTADVRASSRCTLLLIRTEAVQSIFESSPPEITILEWFNKRRYLDTDNLFQEQELTKAVALNVLIEVPIFQNWSVQSLKTLVETMRKDIIVLYPTGCTICREGCRGQEAFILVHGRVVFTSGDQELARFDAGERSFCFGEEGLFVTSERRTTVRAAMPCQVITLSPVDLNDVINQYSSESALLLELSTKWEEHVEKRDKDLVNKYGGGIDMEILRMALKQTSVFRDCPPGFLYIIALSMIVHEAKNGDAVLTESQYLKGETLFVVLQGGTVVMDQQHPTNHSLELNQVFWKTTEMPERAWVKATDLCVVALFPASAVTEAKNTFPSIDLPNTE